MLAYHYIRIFETYPLGIIAIWFTVSQKQPLLNQDAPQYNRKLISNSYEEDKQLFKTRIIVYFLVTRLFTVNVTLFQANLISFVLQKTKICTLIRLMWNLIICYEYFFKERGLKCKWIIVFSWNLSSCRNHTLTSTFNLFQYDMLFEGFYNEL